MKFKFIFCIGMICSALILFTGGAFAQDEQPTPSDDAVNLIAKQIYCPVCDSMTLDVCNSQACKQWRDVIRKQLEDGTTEAEILQYFIDNFGTQVLAVPPKSRWLFNASPFLIMLSGIGVVIWVFFSRKTTLPLTDIPSDSAEKPTDDLP